jgi:hypothetical protein
MASRSSPVAKYCPEIEKRCEAALGLSTGRSVQYGAALASALAGDTVRSQVLMDYLAKSLNENMLVQFNYLSTILAVLAVSHNDLSKAIESLQAATRYELGTTANFGSMCIPSMCAEKPIWLRIKAPTLPPNSRKSSTTAGL